MGSLEDFYANREREQRQGGQAERLAHYNRLIDITQQITSEMFRRIQQNPPAEHDWIMYNDRRAVGWRLWRNYDFDRFFYLLSDGQVAEVLAAITVGSKLKVRRIMDVRHLRHFVLDQELFNSGRFTYADLQELCRSLVSVPSNYGFSNDPRCEGWLRDAGRRL